MYSDHTTKGQKLLSPIVPLDNLNCNEGTDRVLVLWQQTKAQEE